MIRPTLERRLSSLEAASRPPAPAPGMRLILLHEGEPEPPEAGEPDVVVVRFVAAKDGRPAHPEGLT